MLLYNGKPEKRGFGLLLYNGKPEKRGFGSLLYNSRTEKHGFGSLLYSSKINISILRILIHNFSGLKPGKVGKAIVPGNKLPG